MASLPKLAYFLGCWSVLSLSALLVQTMVLQEPEYFCGFVFIVVVQPQCGKDVVMYARDTACHWPLGHYRHLDARPTSEVSEVVLAVTFSDLKKH